MLIYTCRCLYVFIGRLACVFRELKHFCTQILSVYINTGTKLVDAIAYCYTFFEHSFLLLHETCSHEYSLF